jgi:hypothetical protein
MKWPQDLQTRAASTRLAGFVGGRRRRNSSMSSSIIAGVAAMVTGRVRTLAGDEDLGFGRGRRRIKILRTSET